MESNLLFKNNTMHSLASNTELIQEIEVSEALLTSFEEEGYTYLHCVYYTSPKYHFGWWVNMNADCYLESAVSSDKLSLIKAINIPMSPARHYLKRKGDCLRFTLIFPRVPNDWTSFHFRELSKAGDGLSISHISRNNSGVYRLRIA